MKVLLITNLFPTPSDPDRGIFTLQIAKELNKICELTIICPLPWFPKIELLKKFKKWYQLSSVPYQYSIEGLSVYSPKYLLFPKISEPIHAYLMSKRLDSLVKELHQKNNFDVINSQWLYPDSVAVDLIASKLKIPHVATGLGCDINDDLYQPSKAGKILNMLNRVEAVTVVSSRHKDELKKHKILADKVSVILNGVNFEQFKLLDKSKVRKNLGIDSNKKVILYVGRLSHEKCVSSLVAAFAKAYSKNKNLELVLVGDGPEYDSLKDACRKEGIVEQVKFIGSIEHSEINNWFAMADIFCLPSIREGCPNVVLEALASGCPVVASDVGALPDLVSASTGLLFEAENINDICKKLLTAVDNEWDRDAIHKSMKNFSWEQTALSYHSVFEVAAKNN